MRLEMFHLLKGVKSAAGCMDFAYQPRNFDARFHFSVPLWLTCRNLWGAVY